MLPDTAEAGARSVLEQVRAAIEATAAARGFPVTASAGVGVYTSAPGSVEQMLRDAGAALYEAKGRGRNRLAVKSADSPAAPESSCRAV